jgi:hypothetical protein
MDIELVGSQQDPLRLCVAALRLGLGAAGGGLRSWRPWWVSFSARGYWCQDASMFCADCAGKIDV